MTERDEGSFDPDLVAPRRRGLVRRALGTLGGKTRRTTRRAVRPTLRAGGAAAVFTALVIGAKQMVSDPSVVKDLFVGGVENAEQIPGHIKETWEVWTQTKEQREARNLLENIEQLEQEGEIVVVRNAIVGQDGANMRSRPSPNASRIGRLEPGEEIPIAILVRGKIYTGIGEEEAPANWYAFLDPENSGQVAFSFSDNFK